MEELFTFNSMAALATLALLEIVLGIDNVVFLAILTGKLPAESAAEGPHARSAARRRRSDCAALRDLVGDHARQNGAVRSAVSHARVASGRRRGDAG